MELEVGKPLEQSDIWTGIADVQILCVNPTLEEMEKYKLPGKKDVEPVYNLVTPEGDTKFMLKFWVKLDKPEIISNITFFLENKEQISRDGKPRIINDFGQNTYAQTISEAVSRLGKNGNTFFKEEGARVALTGECELIEFIRAWLSVSMESKIKFSDFSKIIKGNISEISNLVKAHGDTRKVQVLLTEKNGYQNIYAKFFGRANSRNFTWWNKHLDSNQSVVNYQNSLNLKKWDSIIPDSEEPKSDGNQGKFVFD